MLVNPIALKIHSNTDSRKTLSSSNDSWRCKTPSLCTDAAKNGLKLPRVSGLRRSVRKMSASWNDCLGGASSEEAGCPWRTPCLDICVLLRRSPALTALGSQLGLVFGDTAEAFPLDRLEAPLEAAIRACAAASIRTALLERLRRPAWALCKAIPFMPSSGPIRSFSLRNFSFSRSKAPPRKKFGSSYVVYLSMCFSVLRTSLVNPR